MNDDDDGLLMEQLTESHRSAGLTPPPRLIDPGPMLVNLSSGPAATEFEASGDARGIHAPVPLPMPAWLMTSLGVGGGLLLGALVASVVVWAVMR